MTTTSGNRLTSMRAKSPLIHCITNYVAMNISANVLLAAGASPAMVHAVEEAEEFAKIASALSINIGTLSGPWVEGMKGAIKGAQSLGKPWVLDPVAHFATAFRRKTIADLVAMGPTVIRGNASEIIALAGGMSLGQGVDSGDSVESAENAACLLASRNACVIAVTGPVDFVTDGRRMARISGGSRLMPRITALGCALTCLVGAHLAVAPQDPFEATVAALATFAVAGERADSTATGPGSFAWQFLDQLDRLSGPDLDNEARIERK